jgi:hypothetical protein
VISRLRGIDVRAWSLYFGLTVPFAILAHLAFDLTDAGLSWAVLLRPAHLGLLALMAVATAAAAYGLGFGLPDAERRRRIALVRAALRVERYPLLGPAAGAVAQAMIVLATLSLDEAALHPERLVLAILVAVLAVLAGAFAVRRAERAVLAIALARAPRIRTRLGTARRRVSLVHTARLSTLFRPNRAPPLLTVAD